MRVIFEEGDAINRLEPFLIKFIRFKIEIAIENERLIPRVIELTADSRQMTRSPDGTLEIKADIR